MRLSRNAMPADIMALIDAALNWAIDHLDSTAYRFKCLAFVEDAYEQGSQIVLAGYGSAQEAAEAYQARQQAGLPPKGTFAFYDCCGMLLGEYRNWGHVGLSLGDGRVIHAWDRVRIDDYRAVEDLTPAAGWTNPSYIGWAPVSEIMKGMTVRETAPGQDS